MKSFKDLEVWQKSISLVVEVYSITNSFPKEETYLLTSQIRKSAVSIPSNIAEGWARGSTNEYKYFLTISRGSLAELETQFIISNKLNYVNSNQMKEVSKRIESVAMMLNKLISILKEKLN